MPMEIESKYVVLDRETFRVLQRAERLADYALEPVGKARLVDRYLDTKGRALTRQGWSCRLRAMDKTWTLALKGPKSVQGSVVSREELEIPLPRAITRPSGWPEGSLRKQVERLTGGAALRELLVIRQSRRSCVARRDGMPVIDMGFDVVRFEGKRLKARSRMVECELMADGTPADLERLDATLVGDYGLIPEPRTKLQRALEFVETEVPPDEALLADRERSAPSEAVTVEELVACHGLDEGRARHVAATVEALYEGLAPLHGLDAQSLSLARAAATLVDLGASVVRAHRNVIARDMLLRQPVVGLSTDERRAVAAALYLHRKKVTPDRLEAAFPTPPAEEWRRRALAVAAMVRLASALDSSRSQSTRVEAVTLENGRPHITITGPQARRDARRARRRSDLWAELFGATPEWEPHRELGADGPGVAAPETDISREVAPDDAITLATSKVLSYHWARMQAHTEGTRQGVDPEELHDMRVATRRMRSAIGLLKSYLHAESLAPAVQGLREVAMALGAVRDLDVSLARARAYASGLTVEERDDLAPLIGELEARRAAAREAMLAHLDGPAYERFVGDFEALLTELEHAAYEPVDDSNRVRSVAPRLIYIRWQVVRAYAPVLDGAPIGLLHALRIECKHLRYALEFFRATLPGPTGETIEQVVAMQGHLGDLHDADVAVAMLDRLLTRHEAKDGARAIEAYRDAQRQERERLLGTFPEAWGAFMGPKLEEAMVHILAAS